MESKECCVTSALVPAPQLGPWRRRVTVAVLAVAARSQTASGVSNCFPQNSELSEEFCCSEGGYADCFDEAHTFEMCCPGRQGTDPTVCFPKGGRYVESVCCMGEGLAECFSPPFTKRACCYSFWEPYQDEVLNLMQRKFRAELVKYDWPVGDFFAELVHQIAPGGTCNIELGVQRGNFSIEFLRGLEYRQAAMPRYYMVDVWREEEHYDDDANIHNDLQLDNLIATLRNVAKFWKHTTVLQLRSREAAPVFKNGECGFVYVDARHDYCAVYEDLAMYWPKLRPGGIMAGDDFGTRETHWIQCENGTFHPGGVRKAVADFSRDISWTDAAFGQKLKVYTVDDQWVMRKPFPAEEEQLESEHSMARARAVRQSANKN